MNMSRPATLRARVGFICCDTRGNLGQPHDFRWCHPEARWLLPFQVAANWDRSCRFAEVRRLCPGDLVGARVPVVVRFVVIVPHFLPRPSCRHVRRKFSVASMGGRAEGLACADPGARTPIGASGIFNPWTTSPMRKTAGREEV